MYSFPILNQSVVPCPILIVASWPAYRFLRRQVRWSGIPISLRFFQFVLIYTVKGFGVINKADRCFSGTLLLFRWSRGCWQCPPAFSKSSLNIWKFTVDILLKPGLENFECYFASVWDEFSCAVVSTFFGIAFLWDWNEKWPFPVLCHCWVFQIADILSAALSQHHLLGFEIAQLEFYHLHYFPSDAS